MTEPYTPAAHMTEERLAAFLDGRLTLLERDQVLAHLSACVPCRREMAGARRILAAARPARRSWVTPLAPVLAAALIVLIALPVWRDRAVSPPREGLSAIERAAQPELVSTTEIFSPIERAVVSDSAVTFRWRRADANAAYHVTLQDDVGSLVWELTVSDTSATVPRDVTLVPGKEYFWSVDARLADGRSARSGAHRFSVR